MEQLSDLLNMTVEEMGKREFMSVILHVARLCSQFFYNY